ETLAYRLVREAFEDLKAHRWSDLGKRFGLDAAEVQKVADELARLDPKPGLQHSSANEAYIIPDLVVEKIDGQYKVFLNDSGLPRLRISKTYQDIARDKKKFQGENKDFINQRMNSAHWMIQAIEQRRQTMLKVMNFIVDRQREFFEKGVEYLKPLTLREVADVINMHESTVSRVTNEKYVHEPRDARCHAGGQRARPREGRGREPARVRAPGARRAAAAPLRRRSGGDRRWQPRRHGRGAAGARGEARVRSRDHPPQPARHR